MISKRLGLWLAVGLVAGCGGGSGSGGSAGSGLNPFGWFAGPRDRGVVLEPEGGFGQVADNRLLVDEVSQLGSEAMVGGVVVTAVGLQPTQGYWDAELVEVDTDPPEAGVLVLEFRIRPPRGTARVSTPPSREVTVATQITNVRLAELREIRVVGQRNVRSIRR
jgi:hypothetical protein